MIDFIDKLFDGVNLTGGVLLVLGMVGVAVGIGGALSFIIVRYISKKEEIKPISEGDAILSEDPTLESYDDDLTPRLRSWVIFAAICALAIYLVGYFE